MLLEIERRFVEKFLKIVVWSLITTLQLSFSKRKHGWLREEIVKIFLNIFCSVTLNDKTFTKYVFYCNRPNLLDFYQTKQMRDKKLQNCCSMSTCFRSAWVADKKWSVIKFSPFN